jgi:SAM-dependent methyltransferase
MATECVLPFRDKGIDPIIRAAYEEQDYLSAYRLHMDWRVQHEGIAQAVGDDWEAGGQRQFAFLKAQGVTPASRVLDVGCGTGRLARLLVPYLEPHHYTGIDLSLNAILALSDLAAAEGWAAQGFRLIGSEDGTLKRVAGEQYDVVWLYAVWIHNPLDVIEACLASLRDVPFAQCFFTYKAAPAPVRTNYKQFAAPLAWYQETARRYGFAVRAVQGMPHIPQPLALLTPTEAGCARLRSS